MGTGDRHHLMTSFHLHLPHLLHHHHHNHRHDDHGDGGHLGTRAGGSSCDLKGIPKGCLAIMVGHGGEEQLQRFVIPVPYINHPLFMQLLKEAEEEFGFDHQGPITLRCPVEEFRNIQGLIDRDQHHKYAGSSLHPHYHSPRGHQSHHHHFLCFRA